MTTTSNRKVRDQSTKSLARILSYSPQIIPDLIKNYKSTDDPYLIERLYAAIYGAVCNINNEKIIKGIAQIVFENVFENGKPYPHILMRDYARGILEFSHNKGFLPKHIDSEDFRPPYKSDWPIENPSNEEIEKIVEDEFSSIKNSVMGFIGDFGKYTMSRVHDWSPTPISESKPDSSFDIHIKFANTLPEDLKRRYIAFIEKELEENKKDSFDLEEFLESIRNWEDGVEEDKEIE